MQYRKGKVRDERNKLLRTHQRPPNQTIHLAQTLLADQTNKRTHRAGVISLEPDQPEQNYLLPSQLVTLTTEHLEVLRGGSQQ